MPGSFLIIHFADKNKNKIRHAVLSALHHIDKCIHIIIWNTFAHGSVVEKQNIPKKDIITNDQQY